MDGFKYLLSFDDVNEKNKKDQTFFLSDIFSNLEFIEV